MWASQIALELSPSVPGALLLDRNMKLVPDESETIDLLHSRLRYLLIPLPSLR